MRSTSNSDFDLVREARERIASASCVLFVTGAGMSAESGVPTFQGDGALWKNRHMTQLANPEAFAYDPKLIWDWYLYRRQVVGQCKPNAGHVQMASWAHAHPGSALVTTNVDGLHQAAYHPPLVVPFHGSLWENQCTQCGCKREDRALSYDALPVSPCCNVLERPAIVWIGEATDSRIWRSAITCFISSEVIIVIGVSGMVGCVPDFLKAAHTQGKYIIEVNPQVTTLPRNLHLQMRATEGVSTLLSRSEIR